ncbi:hypothetical protein CsSME_00031512 [Camellia sinensis var. sinensis]
MSRLWSFIVVLFGLVWVWWGRGVGRLGYLLPIVCFG